MKPNSGIAPLFCYLLTPYSTCSLHISLSSCHSLLQALIMSHTGQHRIFFTGILALPPGTPSFSRPLTGLLTGLVALAFVFYRGKQFLNHSSSSNNSSNNSSRRKSSNGNSSSHSNNKQQQATGNDTVSIVVAAIAAQEQTAAAAAGVTVLKQALLT